MRPKTSLLKLRPLSKARTYFTNNALRQKSDEKKSMALENALGVSMATKGISMGELCDHGAKD